MGGELGSVGLPLCLESADIWALSFECRVSSFELQVGSSFSGRRSGFEKQLETRGVAMVSFYGYKLGGSAGEKAGVESECTNCTEIRWKKG